ncbi:cytochrome b/b6 domain-containing protein [Candidatus Berkiella aquae]|uniref:Cytochrome b n=1 Tax=Candidatus Berkiella aquae TaxID=295108 RepID=A0A0Q9YC11_9GAMM|nr:cytochrome b [Candidatus Berkiella aquae]MCS5711056.1 cytochrome b [Candidatus Berkiella aquae]
MSLHNTTEKFGSLTKLLHWAIFILFVVQYYLVYRREYFPKGSSEKMQYMMLHKTFGLCAIFLALMMLIWRYVGTRPNMPSNMSGLERVSAKLVHFLLYLAMLVMPITGILMSQFGQRPIPFFNWFSVPNLLSKNEALSGFFYNAHKISSYIVIGIVALHILAALFHHTVRKDTVLKRMLPFG